ncbi:two-component sensor histidine kinase [Dactylosporangium roseum]|uniref:histidine kinase n=1 Tax=Dactylosporangium roseum TaxID=47989 RepID=A0ABY5Z1J0_9ACTN|nr:LuxR C-terminal-related transcriptional regulator [Dactylosporangium roseum]UWZ35476.1 two-component sensor histidine kinase [Dactylosporangium roseum]
MLTRMFDERYALARLLLHALCGVGYLLLLRNPAEPRNWVDWAADLTEFALIPLCARFLFAGALAQSAVLAVAALCGEGQTVIPTVGSSWAALELALHSPGPKLWIVTAALFGVNYADDWRKLPGEALGVTYNILILVGVPVLFGANIRATRQLARQAEARATEEARRRLSETRAARADERTAIARELHDVVAHHVASIVLRVGAARHVLTGGGARPDPRTVAVLDDVHTTGTAALADLRQLVTVLRAPEAVTAAGSPAVVSIEPASLPAALEAAADRARQTGVTVDADIDPEVSTLDAVRGLAVLRLTQEALTNVARHAGPAARARLVVRMRDRAVEWSVTDDGGSGPVSRAVGAHGAAEAVQPPAAVALPGLTARERDVLALVGAGLSNQEIADRLHVGVTTVKTHIAGLMTKTGAPNRVRLAILAVQSGGPATG